MVATRMKIALLSAFLLNYIGLLKSDCILERDRYNEYPWLIKIYWKHTWGHGSLIAPNRVLSAYEPFKHANVTTFEDFDFIASKTGPRGIICTAVRRGRTLLHQRSVLRPVIGFFTLGSGFKVGYNFPFLYSRVQDLSGTFIQTALDNSIRRRDACAVPIFQDFTSRSTIFIVPVVAMVDWEDCRDHFTRVVEDDMIFCVKHAFESTVEPSPLLGAIILCQGRPLGLLVRAGIGDAVDLSVFVSLAKAAEIMRTFANSDWPRMTTTATTTTTTEPTTPSTATEKVPTEVTGEPEYEDETTGIKRTTTLSTFVSSRIPRAPTQMHPPTTTRFTGQFHGTPPRHAGFITRRSRNNRCEPLIAFLVGTIALHTFLI